MSRIGSPSFSSQYLGLFVTAFFSITSCTFQSEIPAQSLITCDSNEECPDKWTCLPNVNRCVPDDQIDTADPEIIVGPKITPAFGGYDTEFRLEFTVNEPLVALDENGFVNPMVKMNTGRGTVEWTQESVEGEEEPTFVYTYKSVGNEDQNALRFGIQWLISGISLIDLNT